MLILQARVRTLESEVGDSTQIYERSIRDYIQLCLVDTTRESVQQYGLKTGLTLATGFGITQSSRDSRALIEDYLLSELPQCLQNFDSFREMGYGVTTGQMLIDVIISSEAVVVDLDYPLTFTRGDKVYSFERSAYTLARTVIEVINPDDYTYIISSDRSVTMEIEPGTVASLDGTPISKVGVKLIDRNFDGLTNSVLEGALAFEGIPKGAEFSKPVKITIQYNENNIPASVGEDELMLGYYDDRGIWIGVPTDVDKVQNIITAWTTHFTPLGVVLNCDGGTKNTFTIITPNLLAQQCNPCQYESLDSAWETDGYEYEVFAHDDNIEILRNTAPPFPPCEEGDDCAVTVCDTKEVEDPMPDDLTPLEQESWEQTYSTVWGYDRVEDLRGQRTYSIEFKGGGDSCISARTISALDRLTVSALDVDYEEWATDLSQGNDITLAPLECSPGDECTLSEVSWGMSGGNPLLTFTYTVRNTDTVQADACIHGRVIGIYHGTGINEETSYVECPASLEGQGGDYVLPADDGQGRLCAVCKTDADGNRKWMATDNESKCNGNEFCASTLEGTARYTPEGECHLCTGGRWTQHSLMDVCGNCRQAATCTNNPSGGLPVMSTQPQLETTYDKNLPRCEVAPLEPFEAYGYTWEGFVCDDIPYIEQMFDNLPASLEGLGYTIRMEPGSGGTYTAKQDDLIIMHRASYDTGNERAQMPYALTHELFHAWGDGDGRSDSCLVLLRNMRYQAEFAALDGYSCQLSNWDYGYGNAIYGLSQLYAVDLTGATCARAYGTMEESFADFAARYYQMQGSEDFSECPSKVRFLIENVESGTCCSYEEDTSESTETKGQVYGRHCPGVMYGSVDVCQAFENCVRLHGSSGSSNAMVPCVCNFLEELDGCSLPEIYDPVG